MSARLHYNSFGEGQPIIILHGLFGSSRNWQSIAKSLANNFRIITVDLRNHGQSEHTESMSYFDMAEDIYTLSKILALDDIYLIGHSMGGKVAMVTALQYEYLIGKLIVVDIAPINYSHAYEKLFIAMSNLPLNKINSRNEAVQLLDDQINDRWLTQFILQNLKRTPRGFQWQFNLAAIKKNISHISQFPKIDDNNYYNNPALFIGGEKSDFIREEHHETIRSFFPQSQIHILENAGHMLHIEQADKTLESIRTFLT